MADLTVTASQVLYVSGDIRHEFCGEAITLGQLVYKRDSDLKWLKAQCDGTAEEAGSVGLGLALSTSAAAGQPVAIALPGSIITLGAGAAPVAGVAYYVSNTAGGLSPVADLGTTDKVVIAAIGIGSNQILVTRVYHVGAVLA